ncbi:MAG TPA: hypothetical protein QF753_07395 [Victivallales bacterium]|nr:hypothetical protein [Victivallales bacterium]
MRRKIIIFLLTVICLSGAVVQGESNNSEVNGYTPFRLAFWPEVWAWPEFVDVYGWNLGIPASFLPEMKYSVYGLDTGALFTKTNNVFGIQAGSLCMGDNGVGIQSGFINIQANNFTGLQAAFYNEYNNSTGWQVGIVNKAENSKGVQLGFINIMDNGFLPAFPIINWGGF